MPSCVVDAVAVSCACQLWISLPFKLPFPRLMLRPVALVFVVVVVSMPSQKGVLVEQARDVLLQLLARKTLLTRGRRD